ncbi:uncharacterized protein G2W53_001381 [Senna tora]|uniref:Uncharacterized protein n=1 Tax=Senna tora TaxID=362788 RepID=A0A834XIL9_9FABA|nr:uncharacterized protein G2W53_001381 [Senna tora]
MHLISFSNIDRDIQNLNKMNNMRRDQGSLGRLQLLHFQQEEEDARQRLDDGTTSTLDCRMSVDLVHLEASDHETSQIL